MSEAQVLEHGILEEDYTPSQRAIDLRNDERAEMVRELEETYFSDITDILDAMEHPIYPSTPVYMGRMREQKREEFKAKQDARIVELIAQYRRGVAQGATGNIDIEHASYDLGVFFAERVIHELQRRALNRVDHDLPELRA